MSTLGSVTLCLRALQQGDTRAADHLWDRYFARLAGFVRSRLRGFPRAAADEEDIALSALDSFCRRIDSGKFPHVAGRDSLWSVLVMIASRKVSDLIERECRDKRDCRRNEAAPEWEAGLAGGEPDPAFVAEMADQCRHLLAGLPDDGLRLIATRRLEGSTNEEIAAELDCSLATVERRLALIRACWLAARAESHGL